MRHVPLPRTRSAGSDEVSYDIVLGGSADKKSNCHRRRHSHALDREHAIRPRASAMVAS